MGWALRALPWFALAGCSSLFDIGDPTLATTSSCPIGSYDLCAHQQPAGAIAFSEATQVNTGLDCNVVLFDPQGGSMCVIYASDIDVAVSLTAQGPRPLVLAATGSIHVEGTIDIGSHAGGPIGAGADDSACTVKQAAGTDSGGGAGGSFGGTGGTGGRGTTGASAGGVAGDPVAPPDYPRGGCPGEGGDKAMSGANGGGSAGGGVVWLVAGGEITISPTGRVLAGGAGGTPGGFGPGGTQGGGPGGGGGSGGWIRLAAPSVTVAGTLAANGGGGGTGYGGVTCTGSGAGSDGQPSAAPAAGGIGCPGGGAGGGGAAGTMLAGSPGGDGSGSAASGGGGGGGAGIIVIASPALDTTGATISPPAM